MTVKEALLHPWIKKFDEGMIDIRKQSKNNKASEFEAFTMTSQNKD